MRYHQLGPTTHVLDQAPLVSAIWHPLSPSGNGLVTVTKDACVRLWELDIESRGTFNEPALAVDLKKLSNASSVREDFSASKYGVNKGYSADDVEMQVAGSCFGGQGRDAEDGWSSMTLWIAMTEGDVYALCPFLPAKFWAPPSMLPSLSTSIVAKTRVLDQDHQVSELDKRIAHQQSSWLADLDQQDPITAEGDLGEMEIYSRPERPGVIPRLQGPFQLAPEPDFGEITDIHVIAPKLNEEDFFDDEEDYDDFGYDEGLSVGIVCLATKSSKVHVCLNIEGVEAEWLPNKRARTHALEDPDNVKELLLLDTVQFGGDERAAAAESWTTFTPSPVDRYEFFTTQASGVYSVSFRDWIGALEEELSASQPDAEGVGIRLNVLLESLRTRVDPITVPFSGIQSEVNAAVAVLADVDADVGYAIIALAQNQPYITILDVPATAEHPFEPEIFAPTLALPAPEVRGPYQPADIFYKNSELPDKLKKWRQETASGSTGDVKGQIRFSPYTLQKLTDAHRVLSNETHNLGLAAAELFRRCERMVSEMRAQVEKVRELSNRVNSVTGEDEFPEQKPGEPELVRGGRQKIESRIQQRQEKTLQIKERVENLRRRMRGLGGKELSAKERAFMDEVARLERSVSPTPTPTTPQGLLKMGDSDPADSLVLDEDQESIIARYKAAQDVYQQLTAQAAEVQRELEAAASEAKRPTSSNGGPTSEFRQRKLEQVFALLERESALVDAVSERLEKLQIAIR
jgi:nucleoporin NUP82